jgi:hypothetical protein
MTRNRERLGPVKGTGQASATTTDRPERRVPGYLVGTMPQVRLAAVAVMALA